MVQYNTHINKLMSWKISATVDIPLIDYKILSVNVLEHKKYTS